MARNIDFLSINLIWSIGKYYIFDTQINVSVYVCPQCICVWICFYSKKYSSFIYNLNLTGCRMILFAQSGNAILTQIP